MGFDLAEGEAGLEDGAVGIDDVQVAGETFVETFGG